MHVNPSNLQFMSTLSVSNNNSTLLHFVHLIFWLLCCVGSNKKRVVCLTTRVTSSHAISRLVTGLKQQSFTKKRKKQEQYVGSIKIQWVSTSLPNSIVSICDYLICQLLNWFILEHINSCRSLKQLWQHSARKRTFIKCL